MDPRSHSVLSTAPDPLNWTVAELFASPFARVSMLQCRPEKLDCSCEKCAVDDQIVFVTRGGFVRHTGKSAHVANANKVTIFKANEPYRTSHIDLFGDECVVFSFVGDTLSMEFSEAIKGGSAWQPIGPSAVCSALKIVNGLKNRSMSTLETEEAIVTLLQRILAGRSGTSSAGPAAHALVRDIEAELTRGPGSDWSLSALSRRFRKSAYYITRSFSKITGAPLHKYLLNLRLGMALARLTEGEKDLTALALDLGFSSHAHFSTAFKSALGMNPAAFRSMARLERLSLGKNLKAWPPPSK